MTSGLGTDQSPSRVVGRASASGYPPLVVLAGPPGAGKGTQCSQLAQQHGMVHISIGDTLRQEVTHGTPLGSRIRASLETGQLVPDHDMSEVIAAQLAQHRAGPAVLLDGFPRTLGQAHMLEQLRPHAVELVILLVVPLATVLQRLSGRSRPDDADPDVIAERLLAYDRDTRPVLDWYANRGLLTHIDANASPHDVTTRIATHLTTIGRHTPPTTFADRPQSTFNCGAVPTGIKPDREHDRKEVR